MNFWPALEYAEWKSTYETLHRWLQIVGKVRLSKEPWVNHSWSSTLYVTANGLSTSAFPVGAENLSIDFNFINHCLVLSMSTGQQIDFKLQSESVAAFYGRIMSALEELGIDAKFEPKPNELADATPFRLDNQHRSYDRECAHTCWKVLVRVNNVLKQFRARFIGKCSPVHFFWGSFDLAVSRFSGQRAPEHKGGIPNLPDIITREAYSHEVSSCGFWPGNEFYPNPAFYSYAYPEPPGFAGAKIKPSVAFYHNEMKEFILPYQAVQNAPNPEEVLLSFLQSTYEAAANLGEWPRQQLEQSPYLSRLVRYHM
jgi:hypothetical protein